uniref:Ig-like domain-containing protein n=1 Tax=Zonotrichia albicollis TaxID=44394 RepID=A0A8D2MDJ4_ZONAL
PLVIFSWCSLIIVLLQEAGGGQRAPGDSVTLSCRGSGFTFEDYGLYWYRQSPEGRLEWWVSFISSPKGTIEDYGAAVKDRAKMSRDNSRSEAYLSLRPLQAQDSARYFCAVPRGQEMHMSFNTNIPARGCLRCREGESCQGLEPMGLKAVSKKSDASSVHHRYSWPVLHTAGILIYCQFDLE